MRHHLQTFLSSCAFIACFGQIAHAHEFWIEPVNPTINVGDPLEARTFIGMEFDGDEVANYPSMQVLFDITLGDDTRLLNGAPDQRPAVATSALGEGLHVLRYQSRDFQLTYDSYDDFLAFLTEADRMDLAAEHDARGLSRDAIREVYFRYAKSLIAVGHGEGADKFLGMPWELIAMTNPYTAAQGTPMQFELRFNGDIAADEAAMVFIRDADEVVSSIVLRSDDLGIITVPSDIKGTYLLNAIKILPASPRMETLLGASWQSLWASTTYAIE